MWPSGPGGDQDQCTPGRVKAAQHARVAARIYLALVTQVRQVETRHVKKRTSRGGTRRGRL